MLTDAYLKGLLRPDDVRPIYQALIKNATRLPDPTQTPFEGRTGLSEYLNAGYVPMQGGGDYPTAVSDQLEYGVNDCALSLYAARLGETADARRLADRSHRFLNVIDPQTGFARPRLPDGSWLTPFNPSSETGFKEGSAWHYTWLAPQDVSGLAAALGGVQSTAAKLDQFFSYPQLTSDPAGVAQNRWGAEDQYNPYNETDLQAPYLYNYLGQPWKTQDVVRAAETLYDTTPAGVPGNDDLGTMSSWYVLSTLGLYPFLAGDDHYALTSPLFSHAVIQLQQPWYHASQLVIDAPGASASNRYISGVTVNGHPLGSSELNHASIVDGATIHYDLSSQPGTWATGADTPTSPCSDTPHTADVRITVTPGPAAAAGSPQTVLVRLRNTGTTAAEQVTVRASAPASWSTGEASAHVPAIPPGGSATASLTITPPAATHPGNYPTTITADWSSNAGIGATQTTFAPAQLSVAATSLAQLFNTVGTSPDSNRSVGNLDGGGNSLSRDALAATGLSPGAPVTVDGINMTWPQSGVGQPDDVIAAGQTILPAPPTPGARTLAFLATAGSGVPITATGHLTYTDGTTAPFSLSVSDWTLHHDNDPLLADETVATKMPYRNLASGPQQANTYLFAVSVPVDTSKTVASITLPTGYSGRMNLFAMGLG